MPASRLRYSETCPSGSAGNWRGGAPSTSRKVRTAYAGATGGSTGSKPRRLTYSCPSGNRWATRWAQCTARVVLPTPAVPASAQMVGAVSCSPEPSRMASSRRSSYALPANPRRSGGSCRGTAGSCAGGAGAEEVGVAFRRICWWRSCSSLPGSVPSSSSSTRRACWNAWSASAIRPAPHSASISRDHRSSRRGCWITRCRSSPMTLSCSPRASLTSAYCSIAIRRRSSRWAISAQRLAPSRSPSRGLPRHRPSASW